MPKKATKSGKTEMILPLFVANILSARGRKDAGRENAERFEPAR